MARLYFDVTDIVHFATRYNRVTGIQRVQLNIITLLGHKHGGNVVRCCFFDRSKKVFFEFDPSKRQPEFEFDAERFLVDIGWLRPAKMFPSKVQIKTYLRRYDHRKLLRAWKKADVYFSSLFMPGRLAEKGLTIRRADTLCGAVAPASSIGELPRGSAFVSLGALWFTPAVWQFAQRHRDRGGEVVQMVYDLIPILCPEYYAPAEPPAFTAWLNSALSYASRFICISNWTASDLLKYAAARNQTPVAQPIPLAHEMIGFERGEEIEPSEQALGLVGTKYVLCVGTIESRKNGAELLETWRLLLQELDDDMPLLVFAGKFGRGGAEVQERLKADARLAAYVRIIHSPSDRNLAWLYKNSLYTAYISKIEGWGLPVGEAAWFGKLCVASNATSVPEVCGELADYVDPYDLASIKQGIRRPIVDQAYLQRRESEIAAATLRRWSDVADDIYRFATAAR